MLQQASLHTGLWYILAVAVLWQADVLVWKGSEMEEKKVARV